LLTIEHRRLDAQPEKQEVERRRLLQIILLIILPRRDRKKMPSPVAEESNAGSLPPRRLLMKLKPPSNGKPQPSGLLVKALPKMELLAPQQFTSQTSLLSIRTKR